MNPRQVLLYVAGLVVFIAAVSVALYRQPLVLERLDAGLIAAGVLLAAAATLLQGAHTHVLLARCALPRPALVSIWLTSERAWLNTALPAKAGTIVAVGILIGKLAIPFKAYMRFTLLSSAITALVSVSGSLFLLAGHGWLKLAAAALLALVYPLARFVYRTGFAHLTLLLVSSLLNLLAISAGITICIAGLGHPVPTLQDAVAIGLLLNMLSLVSITPGNFGVREIAIALFAPLLAADVEVILQGSACYVVLRLAASAFLALVLRTPAIAAIAAATVAPPKPACGDDAAGT